MDEDLPVMEKLRKQCIPGFDHNQKLSLQIGSEGL
jgi:hypothetical protein